MDLDFLGFGPNDEDDVDGAIGNPDDRRSPDDGSSPADGGNPDDR